MQRIVKPEILDSLDENDPAAIHNRRDIRLFNRLMGTFRWFTRQVSTLIQEEDRMLEIGAGWGDLGYCLNKRVLAKKGLALDGLDVCSRPEKWPKGWLWHQADLRAFKKYGDYHFVLANLVLHQFEDDELRALGAVLQESTRVLIVNEPARRAFHKFQVKGAKLLGSNYVTDHDALVSVEAGFLGDELPNLLGFDPKQWNWRCTAGILGHYRMVAIRR